MDAGTPRDSTLPWIRKARIFRGLDEALLLEIARRSRTKALGRNQALFRMGDPSFGFFIVAQGSLSLRTGGPSGDDRLLALVRQGESFAEGTLAAHREYPVDAIAESDARVIVIDRTGCLELMRRHPELAVRVMESMGRRMRQVMAQVAGRRAASADRLLAEWLLRSGAPSAPGSPYEVRLPGSKKLLAAELGMSPETLSRCLSRFKRRGVLAVRGRILHILLPLGLQPGSPGT